VPGEFARRAFHAGVLDLTAAEGLADLLNAETAEQRRQALAQAGGALRRQYGAWRAELLRCLAHAEAVIDFGEDERIGASVAADVAPRAAALRAQRAAPLRASAHRGELVRSGVRCALGGAPNAGKSSLLNALAGRDVAIVSPFAGTTRDALEVPMDMGGLKVTLTDTAGLRAAPEPVEAEGVLRARRALAAAHLRVLVLDATAALEAHDEASADWAHSGSADDADNLIVVLNKTDLLSPAARSQPAALLPPWLAARCAARAHAGPWLLSCATGYGLPAFCAALQAAAESLLAAGTTAGVPIAVTRLRHADALRECVACLDRYAAAPSGADELAAEELRAAAAALGRVTGDVDVETVLDVIFSEFCIGK
jgi:tRNA modification GTPase